MQIPPKRPHSDHNPGLPHRRFLTASQVSDKLASFTVSDHVWALGRDSPSPWRAIASDFPGETAHPRHPRAKGTSTPCWHSHGCSNRQFERYLLTLASGKRGCEPYSLTRHMIAVTKLSGCRNLGIQGRIWSHSAPNLTVDFSRPRNCIQCSQDDRI
ncbi:hypothetical protein N656DRAFT_117782 [Canariomyces notabilis]|uniref:Uncharacterized protein n=1 Tax=Canariomyces notabilis TaxID=2074819 RepID=A0AAN6TD72_9PEZI|nr:hypothetical protein N656DRAFT_117782 [Canariomyces arenarius]